MPSPRAVFPTPDCDPPRTRTQAEANELVKRWVLPFLQVYLVGNERFASFLTVESSPPGTNVLEDRGALSWRPAQGALPGPPTSAT
jgi:hypothetical protein